MVRSFHVNVMVCFLVFLSERDLISLPTTVVLSESSAAPCRAKKRPRLSVLYYPMTHFEVMVYFAFPMEFLHSDRLHSSHVAES